MLSVDDGVCHCAHMELRGQLEGIDSCFHHEGPGVELSNCWPWQQVTASMYHLMSQEISALNSFCFCLFWEFLRLVLNFLSSPGAALEIVSLLSVGFVCTVRNRVVLLLNIVIFLGYRTTAACIMFGCLIVYPEEDNLVIC